MLFAMSKSPSIVLTRLDVQRLDEVLNTMDAPIDLLEALENEMLRAKVVSHTRVAPDVVTMNSTVRFADETSGREMVLTLVYPDKAGRDGTISVLAPVGIALLGLKKGQSIDWTGPNGRPLKLKNIDIEYKLEASGDVHLEMPAPCRVSLFPSELHPSVSAAGTSWPSSSSARSVQFSPSSAL